MRRTVNAPSAARTPTPTGSDAATSPPKTRTSTRNVSGMAMISASARSSSITSDIRSKTASRPPNSTVRGPRSVARYSAASSSMTARRSSSPVRSGTRSNTSARRPSSERRVESPVDQYDTTSSVPATAAISSVRAIPAVTASASFTDWTESSIVVNTTRSAAPAPKRASSSSWARTESDDGSSNPPSPRRSAIVPPITKLTQSVANATASTIRGWRRTMFVSRSSIAATPIPGLGALGSYHPE